MSLIGKNPFVNEVLTSCSAEQLTSLSALINNLGSPTVIKLKELKNTDKGVKYASVFLDDFTLVHGLWIYTDTKCGLFAFQNGFDEMQAIRIDTVNKNYEYVYQHLSVTEFRSTLDDSIETQGGEATPWEKSVKEHISYNEATFELDIDSNINMNEYVLENCDDVITSFVSCNILYDNETEVEVDAGNLLDGGRVFKHELTFELRNQHYFYVTFFSSNATEIDSLDAFDEYKDLVIGIAGRHEANDDTIGIMISINSANEAEFDLSDGSFLADVPIISVSDVVTQC